MSLMLLMCLQAQHNLLSFIEGIPPSQWIQLGTIQCTAIFKMGFKRFFIV